MLNNEKEVIRAVLADFTAAISNKVVIRQLVALHVKGEKRIVRPEPIGRRHAIEYAAPNPIAIRKCDLSREERVPERVTVLDEARICLERNNLLRSRVMFVRMQQAEHAQWLVRGEPKVIIVQPSAADMERLRGHTYLIDEEAREGNVPGIHRAVAENMDRDDYVFFTWQSKEKFI